MMNLVRATAVSVRTETTCPVGVLNDLLYDFLVNRLSNDLVENCGNFRFAVLLTKRTAGQAAEARDGVAVLFYLRNQVGVKTAGQQAHTRTVIHLFLLYLNPEGGTNLHALTVSRISICGESETSQQLTRCLLRI
jgi:hypothetical protein